MNLTVGGLFGYSSVNSTVSLNVPVTKTGLKHEHYYKLWTSRSNVYIYHLQREFLLACENKSKKWSHWDNHNNATRSPVQCLKTQTNVCQDK